MSEELCTCGHPWSNHYDCTYCLDDSCCCQPCMLCGIQYNTDIIPTDGACESCEDLNAALKSIGIEVNYG